MNNSVNWFEIYTTDFERAKAFYNKLLNLSLEELEVTNDRHSQMRYAIFPTGDNNPGVGGALVYLDVAKAGIGGTLVYFNSEDIDATVGRAVSAGGKVIRSKQQVGNLGHIALIEDTEGNMIGLRSMP